MSGIESQPAWVCNLCGKEHGRGPFFKISTYHFGTCDVCGKAAAVTEARDFGYLKNSWRETEWSRGLGRE